MRRLLLASCAGLLLLASAPAEEGERNLIANGDLNAGPAKATKIPGWTEVDDLTTFFVDLPGRGRVLRLDTDVLLSDADERWEQMALPAAERPPAKPKGPTKEPKYDTVGGTTGTKVYSDYVRVEPGMRYRLRADVRSDAPVVMIFVKGYAQFEGGYRKFYQCYKNVDRFEPGVWKNWERTFNPTFRSPKVTHIRVMPYAYWPPGEAWVDNIVVTRVGPEKPAGAATEKSLLENGDFEKRDLAPWTAEGTARRVERGSAGACGWVGTKGSLTSPRVPVEPDRSYVLTLRALPSGGVLEVTVEGLVRFGGEWVALFERKETAPPESDDWSDMEVAFHPTASTPQVSHVRVRFTVIGAKGSAYLDDVAIEPKDE